MKSFFLAPCILVLASCQEVAQSPPPFDSKRVDETYEQFAIAYRKADVKMMSEVYADSAIYLNPGDKIKFGRAELMAGFEKMFQDVIATRSQLSIDFQILERLTADDKVIDVGYYRFTREQEGVETISSAGKFLHVLQRQADGSYKFVRDAFNTAPADAWP